MSFIKKEPVLSAAAVLAVLSMFFVAPSPEYLSYIDFRTLALLFSLMTVVAGLKEIGLFRYLGSSLLAGMHSTRQLAFTLTALCFFSSMLITNDVSLITFVPFSILILNMAGLPELMIPVIVLQTIAANLGSEARCSDSQMPGSLSQGSKGKIRIGICDLQFKGNCFDGSTVCEGLEVHNSPFHRRTLLLHLCKWAVHQA